MTSSLVFLYIGKIGANVLHGQSRAVCSGFSYLDGSAEWFARIRLFAITISICSVHKYFEIVHATESGSKTVARTVLMFSLLAFLSICRSGSSSTDATKVTASHILSLTIYTCTLASLLRGDVGILS